MQTINIKWKKKNEKILQNNNKKKKKECVQNNVKLL